jgi:hypothetical protein
LFDRPASSGRTLFSIRQVIIIGSCSATEGLPFFAPLIESSSE